MLGANVFELEQSEMLTHTLIEIRITATCYHWENKENRLQGSHPLHVHTDRPLCYGQVSWRQ
jgi:hypothetical protein